MAHTLLIPKPEIEFLTCSVQEFYGNLANGNPLNCRLFLDKTLSPSVIDNYPDRVREFVERHGCIRLHDVRISHGFENDAGIAAIVCLRWSDSYNDEYDSSERWKKGTFHWWSQGGLPLSPPLLRRSNLWN